MAHFLVAMKKLLFWVLLFGLAACGGSYKQVTVISGEVENCEDCQVVLRYYDHGQLKDLTLKTGRVQQGKFAWAIAADSLPGPGVYQVRLTFNQEHPLKQPRFSGFEVPVYLPADSVRLVLDPAGSPGKKAYPYPKASSHLNFADIQSSAPLQKDLEFYFRQRDSMDVKFDNYKNLRKAFFSQAVESGNKREMDKWADTLNNFFATGGLYRPQAADVFIRKLPSSLLVPYVMLDNQKEMSAAPRFRKYYRAMSPQQLNTFEAKVLDKRLARWEKRNTSYAKYIVGAEITYLTGKTPQGQKLDAGKIFKENKLTLVDFWASWCDSCRMRTPAYRQLYQNYKGKGFEIIGVSLDVNGGAWQKAIDQEKMDWRHLSDMKENYGDISRFRLRGIPANILMNQQGKIVAVDISPEKLKEKLQKQL